jgi:hypothetical protein
MFYFDFGRFNLFELAFLHLCITFTWYAPLLFLALLLRLFNQQSNYYEDKLCISKTSVCLYSHMIVECGWYPLEISSFNWQNL